MTTRRSAEMIADDMAGLDVDTLKPEALDRLEAAAKRIVAEARARRARENGRAGGRPRALMQGEIDALVQEVLWVRVGFFSGAARAPHWQCGERGAFVRVAWRRLGGDPADMPAPGGRCTAKDRDRIAAARELAEKLRALVRRHRPEWDRSEAVRSFAFGSSTVH